MKGCAAEGTRGLAAERVDNHDSRRLILVSRSSPTTRDERRQNPMVAGVLAAAAASAPTDYTRRGSRLMDQCSDGTTPHQPFDLLTNQPGHDLDVDLEPRACSLECSRAGGSDVRHTLHHDRLRLPYGTD